MINRIIVFTEEDKSNKMQGDLFEDFIERLLINEGYEVKKNLRGTGVEYDLVGTEKISRYTCCVECKSSFKSGNKAGDILKLFGAASFGKFRQARFYSAAKLTGGSKGYAHELQQGELETKDIEFSIYGPEEITGRAIETRILSNPEITARKIFQKNSVDHVVLYISQHGYFWGFHLDIEGKEVCFLVSAEPEADHDVVLDDEILKYHDSYARQPGHPFSKSKDFLEPLVGGIAFQPKLEGTKGSEDLARHIVHARGGEQAPNFEALVDELSTKITQLQNDFNRFADQTDPSGEVLDLADRAREDFFNGEISTALESIHLAEQVFVRCTLSDNINRYSELLQLRGRIQLLSGEETAARDVFQSTGRMLRHFDRLASGVFLTEAGRELFHYGSSWPGPALHYSMKLYNSASKSLRKSIHPKEWATLKNYIGESCRLLSKRAFDNDSLQLLDRALSAYRAAGSVFKKNSMKYEAALTQLNVANALQYRGRFKEIDAGRKELLDAIKYLEGALEDDALKDCSYSVARIHHYLGNAYGELGIREGGKQGDQHLEVSEGHFNSSLALLDPKEHSIRWATVQNNLANTLLEMAKRSLNETEGRADGSEILSRASTCCKVALTVRKEGVHPLPWAQTTSNLANVHLLLAQCDPENSMHHFEQAEQNCKSAAKQRRPDTVPLDWVETVILQGDIAAEKSKIDVNNSSTLQKEAMSFYTNVLEQVDEKIAPYYVSIVNNRRDALALNT